MAKKISIGQFDPGIYPRKIWVAKGGTIEQIQAKFTLPNGAPIRFDGDFGAYVNTVMHHVTGKLGELIWYPQANLMPIDFIAHEASHAALDIFEDCNCIVDTRNQEPFAYLIGYIAKCIDQVKRNQHQEMEI